MTIKHPLENAPATKTAASPQRNRVKVLLRPIIALAEATLPELERTAGLTEQERADLDELIPLLRQLAQRSKRILA